MSFVSSASLRTGLLDLLAVVSLGLKCGAKNRRVFFPTAVAIVLFAISQTGLAQKDAGAIAGVARDASGAVISGVTITATDPDHGTAVTVSSNASGEYVIGPLKVGRYTISARKPGFTSVVSTPITLQVQQRVVFDVTLTVGAVNESVTVTDSTAQLQTETSDLGQVIDSRQISNLPLNGRDFAQLALLSPGTAPAAPGSRDQSSFGFSANGARSLQNNFLLDGIDNNSNLPDLLNGSSYVIEPPVESLQEFKVQTSSYTAEFGRGNGAIINAVTHSGTNQLHGAVYEFFRNDALDARNYFDVTRQPYKQNQFGFTVGGPIVLPKLYNGRNRTFFFTDYEGFRSVDSEPIPAIVPTAAQQAGDFSANLDPTTPISDPNSGAPVVDCNNQPTYSGEIFNSRLAQQSTLNGTGFCGVPFGYTNGLPTNIIPNNVIDPLAMRLAALYPAANANNPGYNFISSPKRVINRNNFDVRLDEQVGTADSAFARYSFETVPTNIPAVFGPVADGGDFFSGISNTHYHSLALGETHIFNPHLINEFRFGYNRIVASRLQPGYNSSIAQQIGFPGIPVAEDNGGLPQLTFSDVSTIGSSLYLPSQELQNTYIISDNVTWVVGNHSLKFGAEIGRNEFGIYQPAAPRGTLDFGTQFTDNPGSETTGTGGSGFASFLLGIPDSGSISNAINIDYFRPSWSFYAQDDWKVSNRLTLNYGLRYELYQTVRERNNHEATYDLATQTLIVPKGQPSTLTPQLAALIPVSATGSDGLIKPDLNNFAPRVGLAYTLAQKSVIRAGYGFFYGGSESGPYSNPSAGYNPPYYATNSYSPNCSLGSANPNQTDCSITGLSVLANGFPANALTDPNTPLLYSLDPHLVTPYVQQYQLSTEYQLPQSFLLTVAYAGSHGLKLYTFFNGNEATPSPDPTADVASRRPIPAIDAPIQWFRSSGKSNYNSLQFSVARSAASGLSLLAAYTYAHGLDNASAANLGSQNGGDFRDFRHPEAEYGNSDTDVRHRFTFSSLYPLPVGQGERFLGNSGKALDTVIGHWQLGGIVTLSTGNWYTATDAVNFANVPDGGGNVGSSQRPEYAGNPNSKPCLAGTYFNTCAFTDPAQGSFGNVNRNTIAGPGTEDVDFSVFKLFHVAERLNVEFRSEFFNILNHYNPLFAPAAASATVGATVRDTPGFGFLTAAQAPRQIQFSLKLTY
ncbi:TonB-dependent receptor domain-containing protein [Granulicella sp. S190]|uniref:TonB-dependent receptor domain-containing protein n=1 Tax=Granulicella sp. S190 TaxID=1747226 RepID=UPI00131E690D|nr:TonB-dependent receptor [Granulicella sp. S190]